MNDYISRQVAIDAVNRALDRETLLYSFVRKVVISVLKRLPAANVVPVRLGEWLDGYKMQTCSLCKCRGKKSWTFCPHCGARMIYGERKE